MLLKALQTDYFTCHLILQCPGLWQVKSKGKCTHSWESEQENTQEWKLQGSVQDTVAPVSSICHRAGRSLSPWASQGGRKTSKTSLSSQSKVELWHVTPAHPETLPFPFPSLLPSLGLNHSCLCDYMACACPGDCGECSQAHGLLLLSNPAMQALS